MRILLDSSIYISVLSPEDKLHRATRTLLERFKSPENKFIVPTLIVLEVGNVIQKIKPRIVPSFSPKDYK